MNRTGWIPTLLAALALLAPAARAENASATLLPGDRLHGDIRAPGEFDTLSLYLPSNSTITVEALAEKDSAVLPALEVRDPDGTLLDLSAHAAPGPGGVGVKVKKAPAGALGGVFTFTVTAAAGSSGKYTFRLTAKMPKEFASTETPDPGETRWLGFDAPSGTKLQYSVRPEKGTAEGTFAMGGLRSPGGSLTPLDSLSGSKIPLGEDGTWGLLLENASGSAATAAVTVHLTLPKASKRELHLSPFGFGEAPKVKTVEPSKVLDDRTATGVAVTGANFDAAAEVRLEKKDQEPIPASNLVVAGPGSLTADFEVVGAKSGGWKLVVENPSGGSGKKTLKIQSASSTKLPPGVVEGTEVWWLDFDENPFREDLRLMGLQSESSRYASAQAESAVKSYALRYLRLAFGLDPGNGKTTAGSVPVSFVVEEPPKVVGTPGAGYGRLAIGGAAAAGDPSSNPYYGWGDGPYDAGNAAYEDIGPDAGPALGLKSRVLQPSGGTSVPAYQAALKPLLDRPLNVSDEQYFMPGFYPDNSSEGARYRQIILAVQTAGKELGATIAHFVARAMGTADGAGGLSSVPQKVGTYAALADFAFSLEEMGTLASQARAGLPGTSKVLHANYFPYAETLDYLLPTAYTTEAYSQGFEVVGGRPEKYTLDLTYSKVGGVLPPGYTVSPTGVVGGTAPLRRSDLTLLAGVYRFTVRMEDTATGEDHYFNHRINLLVDESDPGLTPAEVSMAQQLNAQVINTP